jgi:hypothetical protein
MLYFSSSSSFEYLEGSFPRFGCEGWETQEVEGIVEGLYGGPDLNVVLGPGVVGWGHFDLII